MKKEKKEPQSKPTNGGHKSAAFFLVFFFSFFFVVFWQRGGSSDLWPRPRATHTHTHEPLIFAASLFFFHVLALPSFCRVPFFLCVWNKVEQFFFFTGFLYLVLGPLLPDCWCDRTATRRFAFLRSHLEHTGTHTGTGGPGRPPSVTSSPGGPPTEFRTEFLPL